MLYLSPHLPSIRPGKAEAEQAAIPPGNQQKFNPSSGASNTDEAVPPWMSGGATAEDVDGMTARQEQDFVGQMEARTGQSIDASDNPALQLENSNSSNTFDDQLQSGYHGEKTPQGQDLPAKPAEGDTSDGASAVFNDVEAEDKRGYSGDPEVYSNNIPISSPEDIANNPKALYGKSKEDIASILDEGWTEGAYGSKKQGWKFTKGDKSIFYHPGGGRHGGAYYGYSSAETGKVKIVGKDYIPIPGDKATIIYIE